MSARELSASDIETAHERIYGTSLLTTDGAYLVADDVARTYGIERGDMLGKCRDALHIEARVALYTRLRQGGWSYPMIGRFAHRHHTSVMWLLGAVVKTKDRKNGPRIRRTA